MLVRPAVLVAVQANCRMVGRGRLRAAGSCTNRGRQLLPASGWFSAKVSSCTTCSAASC